MLAGWQGRAGQRLLGGHRATIEHVYSGCTFGLKCDLELEFVEEYIKSNIKSNKVLKWMVYKTSQ